MEAASLVESILATSSQSSFYSGPKFPLLSRPVEEHEVLFNNLLYAIEGEEANEKLASAPSSASEEILLQQLMQRPLPSLLQPSASPTSLILDLDHYVDGEKLPEKSVEGLCCSQKHWWKGGSCDVVIGCLLPTLDRIVGLPFNAGDNPFKIATNYCQEHGIQDFAVMQQIVDAIKKRVPEEFLDLTAVAPSPDRQGGSKPFVPIVSRMARKKKTSKSAIVRNADSTKQEAKKEEKMETAQEKEEKKEKAEMEEKEEKKEEEAHTEKKKEEEEEEKAAEKMEKELAEESAARNEESKAEKKSYAEQMREIHERRKQEHAERKVKAEEEKQKQEREREAEKVRLRHELAASMAASGFRQTTSSERNLQLLKELARIEREEQMSLRAMQRKEREARAKQGGS